MTDNQLQAMLSWPIYQIATAATRLPLPVTIQKLRETR